MDADDVIDSYRQRLEAEGFEVREEHDLRHDESRTTSVTGVQEATDRVVFLATAREDGGTRMILGYGEGDGSE